MEGLSPAETTSIIRKDINGNIITDINTAVVTPGVPAAGYVPPEIQNYIHNGPGSGSVSINVIDPDSIKNFTNYRLEFQNSSKYFNSADVTYNLIDYSENDTLIKNALLKNEFTETTLNDGFALEIINDKEVLINSELTGWKTGNSNYIAQTGFDPRFSAAYLNKKIAYPADFEIYFLEKGEGDISFPATSFSQPIQSNIIVKNVTEGIDHFQFIFRDENKDEMFNENDALFIVFGDSLGKPANSFSDLRVGWSFSLIRDTTLSAADQIHPMPGDVFRIVTKKPFRTGEYVQFNTQGSRFDKSLANSGLDQIAVVPNPYVGAAAWEPLNEQVGRGDRKIYFIHLPNQCTIRIYSLSGKLVNTIEHNSSLSDGEEPWNLVSKDGMDISFGVYVFHIDAPGIGEKIGKFAIIK